jgi:uncharacterized RDD family membrane protein YckC
MLTPMSVKQVNMVRRLAALTIDWIAAYLITNAFRIGPASGKSATIMLIFFVEVMLLIWLQGASLGHRLMGLKVVDYYSGGAISPIQAFVRTLLVCLVVTAITYDDENRGLHERFSRTKLIRS